MQAYEQTTVTMLQAKAYPSYGILTVCSLCVHLSVTLYCGHHGTAVELKLVCHAVCGRFETENYWT